MSDDAPRLMTRAEAGHVDAARRRGGLCGLCGRMLIETEPVYIEQLVLPRDQARETDVGRGPQVLETPVGVECVSPEFLSEMQGREAERCAGCGRAVFYRVLRSSRHRALCSRRCASRADLARHKNSAVGRGPT